MKRWIAALMALCLLCTLAACGKDKTANRTFSYPLSSEPKSLDPQICGDADTATAVGSLYEGLVRLGADGKILPGVAQSMDVSDNGLEYTFRLRTDAKWHIIRNFKYIYGEGCEKNLEMPVTAEDFVFAFQRIFSAVTNTPGADTLYAIRNAQAVHEGALTPLELGVKAEDANTFVITLEKPSADFLSLLTQPICAPCNRFFFESTKGKYGLGLAYTMCNGPFYLSNWSETNNLHLRRNPDYIGEQAVIPSDLYFYFNNDRAAYAQKVGKGSYSAAPIEREYLDTLTDDATLVEISNTVWGMAFNCADENLSNAYLRMALCSAFSTDTLEMADLTPAAGLVPSACRISGENYREKAGSAERLEENADRALLFMEFALKELETKRINLTISCPAEYETAMRKVIQRWQKVFGVTVSASTNVLDDETLRKAQASGDYQVAFVPVKASATSAVQTLYGYTAGDDMDFGLEEDTEYESYLRAALTAPTGETAVQCCLKAESYLVRTGIFYPLFTDTSSFAFNSDVQGVTLTPCGEQISFVTARKFD